MLPLLPCDEPIRVSARFQASLESAIAVLEAGAVRDERVLPLLGDPDHRRRQRLLIGTQRLRAYQLRELLARTAVRGEARA
jgi:hypothetical protein